MKDKAQLKKEVAEELEDELTQRWGETPDGKWSQHADDLFKKWAIRHVKEKLEYNNIRATCEVLWWMLNNAPIIDEQ